MHITKVHMRSLGRSWSWSIGPHDDDDWASAEESVGGILFRSLGGGTMYKYPWHLIESIEYRKD